MWTFPSFESWRQDVRFAVRALRKSPAFTLVSVGALAIGIGGNTAIFSLMDALRARAMPYKDSSRLVVLWGNVMRTGLERRGASYPDYLDWRAQSRSLEDIAAWDGQTLTLAGTAEAERIPVEFVSAPYFSLLGISSSVGRTFRDDEDLVAKPVYVVVLGDGLWKRRFGGDPAIVGSTVTLNAQQYTVVGVMPPGFRGLTDTADLWVPFATWAPPRVMADRGTRGFAAVARLKPGVVLAGAQADLDAISRGLETAYPQTNEKRGVEISPLEIELARPIRPALQTLMAAVVFVLLIACANIANLLLARSEAGRREIAVRTALGAGRGRLIRQLMTESCVLTFVGAAAGLLLARAATPLLIAKSPVTFPSFVSPTLDVRIAAFTIAVSLACGILVGLAPALQAQSVDVNSALKEAARSTGGERAQRMRGVLVVAEFSPAVVLLVGAGLMIRSVRNLVRLDPGFDPSSLLTLHVSIPRASVPQTPAPGMVPPSARPVIEGRVLLDRVRALPGVTAVSLGTDLPLDGNAAASFYAAEGMPDVTAQNRPRAYVHRILPGFFETLRIRIVQGRTFTDAEVSPASPAVIVSEGVVKRFWPGQDPIGKRIRFGPLTSDSAWLAIVGVVGEVKYRGLPSNPTGDPDIYLPFVERNSQYALALRTSGPPLSLAAPVRALIQSVDRSIPVYAVATMEDQIANQTSQSRFTMWLMSVFAAIALGLAVVGIYGVMSYLVAQRTREIGIRIALGASGGDILRLVVGNGARLIAAGIVLGIAGSFALQRLMTTLLFDVTAADTASAFAIGLLTLVALAACAVPAARAARVDPLLALRYE